MPLLWVALGIGLMLILMLGLKFDAFFALLLTSFAVGLLAGMDVLAVLQSVLKGVGTTMGNIALILVFGAMLGRLIDESGAAHTITYRLTALFGERNIQFAILVTGFLVGLPMLYNAGFLVLIPLIYTLAGTTGLPLMQLALPMAAPLSTAHGFLPPHPAPTFVSFVYGADVNKALFYGLVPVLLAGLAGGILLPRLLRNRELSPPPGLYQPRTFERHQLPGLAASLVTALTPVVLMLTGALTDVILGTSGIDPFRADYDYYGELARAVPDPTTRDFVTVVKFLGNANVALMAAVLIGLVLLGLRRGRAMEDLMRSLSQSVGTIASILFIIAAGGAFSQVLRDSGVTKYIEQMATGRDLNPLLLAFLIATLLRVAVGSATVATLTTAGIMAPIAASSGIRPELMVIATGAGSLMLSHFNDSGFWMFKEYFNASIKDTFAVWTTMETVVGLVGLASALAMNAVL